MQVETRGLKSLKLFHKKSWKVVITVSDSIWVIMYFMYFIFSSGYNFLHKCLSPQYLSLKTHSKLWSKAGSQGNHHDLFRGFSSMKEAVTNNLSIGLIERFLIKNKGCISILLMASRGQTSISSNNPALTLQARHKTRFKKGIMAKFACLSNTRCQVLSVRNECTLKSWYILSQEYIPVQETSLYNAQCHL